MKLFLMSLALAAAPQWFMSAILGEDAKKGDTTVQVVVVSDDEGDTGHAHCVLTTGAGAGEAKAVVVVAGKGDDDGPSEKKLKYKVLKLSGGKDRGYLGVSIAEVPEALAAQLNLEDRGILVENVAEDSPADRAGLEAHDVILSIDGETIEGDVGDAVDRIKSHKPGEQVDLVVLRNGREKEITVTLGSRSEVKGGHFAWKFKGDPDAEVEDRIRTRGLMMRRGDDGEWLLEDLGNLHALKNLPRHLKMFLPRSGSRSIQLSTEGGKKRIRIKVEHDGQAIIIKREGKGEITVTRVDENGEETEATYQDEEALRKADEEAYNLLQDTSESCKIDLDLRGLGGAVEDFGLDELSDSLKKLNFNFDFDFDSPGTEDQLLEWREHLEQGLQEAREAQEQAMKELRELMKEWNGGDKEDSESKLSALPRLLRHGQGARGWPSLKLLHRLGKPRNTFEVQKDGTIEVRIRKGDSELVRRFESADDLAQKDPALYKKYERLQHQESEKDEE